MCTSSVGSGETVRMRSLAIAYAARLYHTFSCEMSQMSGLPLTCDYHVYTDKSFGKMKKNASHHESF